MFASITVMCLTLQYVWYCYRIYILKLESKNIDNFLPAVQCIRAWCPLYSCHIVVLSILRMSAFLFGVYATSYLIKELIYLPLCHKLPRKIIRPKWLIFLMQHTTKCKNKTELRTLMHSRHLKSGTIINKKDRWCIAC